MNKENEMKVEFASKSINESFARSVVASFVAPLDPTIEELSDIKTAVSEAVTNSIIHAYSESDGIIRINGSIEGNTVEIDVIDYGIGIEDVQKAREPLYTTKCEMERSGMGFLIMENFMDELKIDSVVGVGTKVHMKKNIKKNLF